MSTSGIFTLITNDGKQDRMLMATELLKRRLDSIKMARRQAGMKDTTPTLLDIERTHVLFMNAHFKPFAAIGFEYNKVTPASGAASALGSTLQFSIPQFGDFFNDIAFYCRFNRMMLFNTVGQDAPDPGDFSYYRYCDYPGERLIKQVRFEVNGNPLDQYDTEAIVFHRQFNVNPNVIVGWNRLVGQETPQVAFLNPNSAQDPAVAPVLVGDEKWGRNRVKLDLYSGYQTPKRGWSGPGKAPLGVGHEALEVMVPLLFWFNKDPRLAVPSVSIPYGQRFLYISLAGQNDLVQIVSNGAGDPGAFLGNADSSVATPQAMSIEECHLAINNIFVNPEVHDIFIKRIGFSLIRVHRYQVNLLSKSEGEFLLNQLKWPVEYLDVGVRPVANTTVPAGGSNLDSPTFDNWWRFGHINRDAQAEVEGVQMSGPGSIPGKPATATVSIETPTLRTLNIKVHGIDVYKHQPGIFFNAYQPYVYGGHNVNTPADNSVYRIMFCMYPGSYQPSGHINVSRAREFYFAYTSASYYPTPASPPRYAVESADPCNCYIYASALNFLLISDGSAVLRYST